MSREFTTSSKICALVAATLANVANMPGQMPPIRLTDHRIIVCNKLKVIGDSLYFLAHEATEHFVGL